MSAHPILPSGYGDWLKSLKSRIVSARQRAALAVNQELVTLYHSIGKDILQRQFSEGWSRPTLDSHIKSQLHLRQGGAVTNFDRHLPAPQAQLAAAALKDPYLFDFLGLYFRESSIHAGRNM